MFAHFSYEKLKWGCLCLLFVRRTVIFHVMASFISSDAGWLAGWLARWLAGWPDGLLASCVAGWFAAWLVGPIAPTNGINGVPIMNYIGIIKVPTRNSRVYSNKSEYNWNIQNLLCFRCSQRASSQCFKELDYWNSQKLEFLR